MALPMMMIKGAMVAAPAVSSAVAFAKDRVNDKESFAKEGFAAEQSGFQGPGSDMSRNALMAGGGLAAAGLALKDGGLEGFKANPFGSAKNAVGRGLAGAASAGFAKLANDAIQAEGGSGKAAAFSALSGGFGSLAIEGGPGFLKSAAINGAAGFGADKLHDNLTEKGHGHMADMLAGGVQGSALGGTTLGNKTGVLGGAALGGSASTLAGLAKDYFGSDDTALSAQVPQMEGMVTEQQPSPATYIDHQPDARQIESGPEYT